MFVATLTTLDFGNVDDFGNVGDFTTTLAILQRRWRFATTLNVGDDFVTTLATSCSDAVASSLDGVAYGFKTEVVPSCGCSQFSQVTQPCSCENREVDAQSHDDDDNDNNSTFVCRCTLSSLVEAVLMDVEMEVVLPGHEDHAANATNCGGQPKSGSGVNINGKNQE